MKKQLLILLLCIGICLPVFSQTIFAGIEIESKGRKFIASEPYENDGTAIRSERLLIL